MVVIILYLHMLAKDTEVIHFRKKYLFELA